MPLLLRPIHSRRDVDATPTRQLLNILAINSLIHSRRDVDATPTRRRRDADATPTRRRRDVDATPTRRRRDADATPTPKSRVKISFTFWASHFSPVRKMRSSRVASTSRRRRVYYELNYWWPIYLTIGASASRRRRVDVASTMNWP